MPLELRDTSRELLGALILHLLCLGEVERAVEQLLEAQLESGGVFDAESAVVSVDVLEVTELARGGI